MFALILPFPVIPCLLRNLKMLLPVLLHLLPVVVAPRDGLQVVEEGFLLVEEEFDEDGVCFAAAAASARMRRTFSSAAARVSIASRDTQTPPTLLICQGFSRLRSCAPPVRQPTVSRILRHCIKNLGTLQGFSLVNVLFFCRAKSACLSGGRKI